MNACADSFVTSLPVESAFIDIHMQGLTLPDASEKVCINLILLFGYFNIMRCICFTGSQVDPFPSPVEIASDKHKRYWVNNNNMVRGQLVIAHKWMLFIPSHCPSRNDKVSSPSLSSQVGNTITRSLTGIIRLTVAAPGA